uniref:MARVEL domain-containing protein n=1 Tax=Neovison vison TaxID=452646 RepID=A0A8C7AUN1_NEOVI
MGLCFQYLCSQSPGQWLICIKFSIILRFAWITSWLVILTCSSTSTPGPSSLLVVETILATIFFAINMCDLQTKIETISWPWSDFLQTLTVAILYLITSTIVLIERGNHYQILTGLLGLITTCHLGYAAYMIHTAAPTDLADGAV